MTPPISARLTTEVENLQALASAGLPVPPARLVIIAARLAILASTAQQQEAAHRRTQRTADELAEELTADTHRAQPPPPDMQMRHRYNRIIAGILAPDSYPGCHFGRPPA
jgi:glycerol-3-phosphate O-acyltransferase